MARCILGPKGKLISAQKAGSVFHGSVTRFENPMPALFACTRRQSAWSDICQRPVSMAASRGLEVP